MADTGQLIIPGPGPLPGATSTAGLSDVIPRTPFTPTFSFATLGDLALSSVVTVGYFAKVGGIIAFYYSIRAFLTWTTASGNLIITPWPPTGAPTPVTNNLSWPLAWVQGLPVLAGQTTVIVAPNGPNTALNVYGNGSLTGPVPYTAANMVSGNNILLQFGGVYF